MAYRCPVPASSVVDGVACPGVGRLGQPQHTGPAFSPMNFSHVSSHRNLSHLICPAQGLAGHMGRLADHSQMDPRYGDGEPLHSPPKVLLPQAVHYVPFSTSTPGVDLSTPSQPRFRTGITPSTLTTYSEATYRCGKPIKKWVDVDDVAITFIGYLVSGGSTPGRDYRSVFL